jgi:hypothetical protein
MKGLLRITAAIEAATGLCLIAVPAMVVRLLLGSELLGAGIPLGRLTGVALLALGVACWLVSSDTQNCAARGVVTAMTLYNIGAVFVLGVAGLQPQGAGIGLWPAVALHAVMLAWCMATLLQKQRRESRILTR